MRPRYVWPTEQAAVRSILCGRPTLPQHGWPQNGAGRAAASTSSAVRSVGAPINDIDYHRDRRRRHPSWRRLE